MTRRFYKPYIYSGESYPSDEPAWIRGATCLLAASDTPTLIKELADDTLEATEDVAPVIEDAWSSGYNVKLAPGTFLAKTGINPANNLGLYGHGNLSIIKMDVNIS